VAQRLPAPRRLRGQFSTRHPQDHRQTTVPGCPDSDTLSAICFHNLSKRPDIYRVAMGDKVEGLSAGRGISVDMRHRF